MRKPAVGDTVYYPSQTSYRDESKSCAPLTQFVVSRGVVKQVIHGGYTQYLCLIDLIDCDSIRKVYIAPQLKDFGDKVYFEKDAAVRKAESMSKEYERNWSGIFKEEFPMRMVLCE